MGDANVGSDPVRRRSHLTHIDAVCDQFEAAWRSGQQPRIEDYLPHASEDDREALLRRLLAAELAYRRARAEQPAAEEYRQRFPAYWERIKELFGETTAPAIRRSQDSTVSVGDAPRVGPIDLGLAGKRYEILELVGRGGMGAVYRARHRGLDRQVAIKVLLPGLSAERFLREAKLLARVNSPYVVGVQDFDFLDQGSAILVMDWVEGTNLDKILRKRARALSEEEGLKWMREVCEGMIAAESQGIVHRDLKPSNILIDNEGRARVADFGLARGPVVASAQSLAGQLLGTPYYMAPEQAEDPRWVDTRADIYSFGASFYHALTGEPPFEGETAFTILYKHKIEPLVSPRLRNREISSRTSDILERCLAKSPSERFSSFGDLRSRLAEAPAAQSAWEPIHDLALAPHLERYRARKSAYLDETVLSISDTYDFPCGRRLHVLTGDITHERADAIVSSDDEYLSMDAGVSRSIWLAGGRSIEKEARARVPVRPGRVAVTRAGDLAARFVFHAATNGSAMGEMILPSRDLVLEIMASCFYQADTFYVREIAFPLLATGLAAFRPDICLDAMFQFLARALLRGDTCVSDARIVLYRACPDYQVEVNGQTLELHHGNIARQKVDAIVNSIGQALTGGAVSGMIYHRGGHRIYDELRSKCPQGRPVAPVVLTAAGRLPAKYVIHTVCPDWRGGDHGEPELLAEAYRRSLKLAVGYGCASVAFPALSIGGWGYPLETASRVALATVIHYLRNSRDLKLVRFVLFSPAVYEAFVSALRELT